jgi:hypothetical protein
MLQLIQKIGFFRLLQVPIGIAIIIGAIANNIIGMGIIGVIVLIFGLLNKCLLMGKCEVDLDRSIDKKDTSKKIN